MKLEALNASIVILACTAISFAQDPDITRVVVSPRVGDSVCTVEVTYFVGSRDDPLGSCGLSHLTEHLLFDGTVATSEGEFGYWIESVGGNYQGSTGETRTVYVTTVPREDLDLVLFLENDRRQHAALTDQKILDEKAIVEREIETRQRNHVEQFRAYGISGNFFTNSPEECRPVGLPNEVRKITSEQVRSFYRTHYHRPASIVVTGGCPSSETLQKLRRRLAPLQLDSISLTGTKSDIPSAGANQHDPAQRVVERQSAMLLIIIELGLPTAKTWQGFQLLSEISDQQSQEVLDSIAKRIQLKARPEFRIQSKYGGDVGTVLLRFSNTAALDRYLEHQSSMFSEMLQAVTDSEIDAVQQKLKIADERAWQDSINRAETISRYLALYETDYDPLKVEAGRAAISRKDIQTTCWKLENASGQIKIYPPPLSPVTDSHRSDTN